MSRYGLTIDEDRKLKRILREKVMQRQRQFVPAMPIVGGIRRSSSVHAKNVPGYEI